MLNVQRHFQAINPLMFSFHCISFVITLLGDKLKVAMDHEEYCSQILIPSVSQ